MSELVVGLTDVGEPDAGEVGRKAASLGALRAAGYPVPAGLCVTTAAFSLAFAPFLPTINGIVDSSNLQMPAEADAAAMQIGALLADLVVPESVIRALWAAWREFLPEDVVVAVRSSAIAEDLEEISFAGEYATVLGLHPPGVDEQGIAGAILTCWRSYFSANALVARARIEALGERNVMGILIQPLIEAECAGVCLTLDPTDVHHGLVLISAAWGLGEGVVNGRVATDNYWIRRRDLRLDRRHIADKPTQFVRDLEAGTAQLPVPAKWRDASCLPDTWAQRIAQFALAAENFFGSPQDVEWAVADGQIWILQSRPLTGLPAEQGFDVAVPVSWENQEESRKLWTLVQIPEGGAPALLPLQMDYLMVTEEVREETCRFMGAERNRRIKFVNGRAYACPVPLGLSEADLHIRRTARRDLKDRLQRQAITLWDYWGPEAIRAADRLRDFDSEAAGEPELARHLEETLAVLRRHHMLHPLCSYKPNPSFFAAFSTISGLAGEDAEVAAYGLLGGEETILTRLIDDLYALTCLARDDPATAALIVASPSEITGQLAALPAALPFCRRLDKFLDLYGDRTGDGYGSDATLLTPTWREEPKRVLDIVASFLVADGPPPSAARARSRQERDARVEALCAASLDDAAVAAFRTQLAYARRAYTILEEHNHILDQMSIAHVRRAVLAAADRLVNQGVLADRDEVFWLTFNEILDALRAPSAAGYMKSIGQRRARHDVWRQLTPPPILGIPAADLPDRGPSQRGVTPFEELQGGVLKGLGASPGRFRGRARVVENTVALPDLAIGDILVAENVGPRWTPLFPILGGLILDGGSPGQHAAATAREYAVPAVVGTEMATRRIADGDWVTVDGTEGRVVLA